MMDLNFNKILQDSDADCILLNTFDEFLSEYTEKKDNLLFQITGFAGSSGIALICKNARHFFTDGRYLLQARAEISSDFKIHNVKDFHDVFANLKVLKILLDEKRFAAEFCLALKKKNEEINFINWKHNLTLPFENKNEYYNLPENLVGESSGSKIAKIREHLNKQNAGCYYVTDCQNICWILNIRGNDEEFTPIFKTHLIVTHDDIKLGRNLGVENGGKVLVDLQMNFETYKKIDSEKVFCNFITGLKAIKNDVEIVGIENSHKIDGIILTKFLQNLEENYKGLTEFEIGERLLMARRESEFFVSPSFASICGHAENGAVIHYNAKKESAKVVGDGVFLMDSGGQFCDFSAKEKILGTTDVTRTIYLGGEPMEEYKKVFTLVLMGHIAVATAEFSEGTTGKEIDILARKALIENGYNYDHGTGHGVGAFLSVHEAGVGISTRNNTVLKEGMLVSNEPGCYIEGRFGVRIENLVLVEKKENGSLGFKTLTLVPIQEKSINFEMLSQREIDWIRWYNNYSLENAR